MHKYKLLITSSMITDMLPIYILNNTVHLEYDYYNTKNFNKILSIIENYISNHTDYIFNSVGIMFHSTEKHTIQLFKSDTVKSMVNDEINKFSDLIKFFKQLKIITRCSQIDLISGNTIDSVNNLILNQLELKSKLTICASTTNTGKLGNWILEKGNINLTKKYFTNKIIQSEINLGITVYSFDTNTIIVIGTTIQDNIRISISTSSQYFLYSKWFYN